MPRLRKCRCPATCEECSGCAGAIKHGPYAEGCPCPGPHKRGPGPRGAEHIRDVSAPIPTAPKRTPSARILGLLNDLRGCAASIEMALDHIDNDNDDVVKMAEHADDLENEAHAACAMAADGFAR